MSPPPRIRPSALMVTPPEMVSGDDWRTNGRMSLGCRARAQCRTAEPDVTLRMYRYSVYDGWEKATARNSGQRSSNVEAKRAVRGRRLTEHKLIARKRDNLDGWYAAPGHAFRSAPRRSVTTAELGTHLVEPGVLMGPRSVPTEPSDVASTATIETGTTSATPVHIVLTGGGRRAAAGARAHH